MQITELYKQINRENSFEHMDYADLHAQLETTLDRYQNVAPNGMTTAFVISNYMLDEYNSLKEELAMLKANNNASPYENDGEENERSN